MAPLLGNDFISSNVMNNFYIEIAHLRPSFKKITHRHKIIISVIKWLSKQKESAHTIFNKVKYMYKKCFNRIDGETKIGIKFLRNMLSIRLLVLLF